VTGDEWLGYTSQFKGVQEAEAMGEIPVTRENPEVLFGLRKSFTCGNHVFVKKAWEGAP
jgi:hypothetical protein